MMPDPLARLEDEMAAAAADAAGRFRVAAARLGEADEVLGELRRPTWGGPVDSWHRAAEAVRDALEAVEAFEAFGPVD